MTTQQSAEQKTVEQVIRQIVDRWFDAENRRDLDGTMEFVSEDLVLQPPDHPPVEGRSAFRAFMAQLFESQVSVGGGTWKVEVSESSDMAYGIGPNWIVLRGPAGEVRGTGKWFIVWKKQGSEWKAVAMSYSGDAPVS